MTDKTAENAQKTTTPGNEPEKQDRLDIKKGQQEEVKTSKLVTEDTGSAAARCN